MNKPVVRNIWVDNLRSFLTVLVVAHHSSLAYTTFAKFDKGTYINSTAPVVDQTRWVGLDIFENFNDIFFMSLMFMISGLFFYNAISKKGLKIFLTDRVIRLGLPFAIVVTLIIPFAYYPSFYLATHQTGLIPFFRDFIFHQHWPPGPPWFIWILLAFNLLAGIIPLQFYKSVNERLMNLSQRPFIFFLYFFVIACVAYIPLSLWVGQYKWTGLGPFVFQLNRIALYFLFFVFGACLGSCDWERRLFKGEKLLNKSVIFWIILCFVIYTSVDIYTKLGSDLVKEGLLKVGLAYFIFGLLFVASCICSSFAFIAFFHKRLNKTNKPWGSLSANAYGIYLIHYVFVTWIQFALLNTPVPAILKFLLVFSGALSLSWLVTSWIRKFRLVGRVI
jgi:glucans biosynthesis protein C